MSGNGNGSGNSNSGGAATGAPTGCYKCGRPGHWSRDCPSSSSANPNPNPNLSSTPINSKPSSKFASSSFGNVGSVQKPKKPPRTRPKLTPEILLSDDGIGYILKYFPRHFKYRGRGYEVNDLRNLLRMYAEWHSHLLPYYSIDQFVHRVEEVGSTKRLKTCLRDLKEKIADGWDPAKWNEPTVQQQTSYVEDPLNPQDPTEFQPNSFAEGDNANEIQGDILNEMFNQTVKDVNQSMPTNSICIEEELQNRNSGDVQGSGARSSSVIMITEEQKARMEDNKRKALERAAARGRTMPTASLVARD